MEEFKKITIALLGGSKEGKTTAIATLTSIPEQIIRLSSKNDTRTKTTVQYHLVQTDSCDSKEIRIEEIELFEKNVMGSPDGNIEKFNNNLKEYSILTEVLELEKCEPEEKDLKGYITKKIDSLKENQVSPEKLRSLMSTEGIDRYIRRLTLSVPVQEDVGKFLKENNIDLFVRDTRGLLDIALQEDGRINRSSPTLRELGLEGLDGIVFFCSTTYPNIINSLYRNILGNVLQSVPVFLVSKDVMMYAICGKNNQNVNYENINNMIECLQNGNHKIYSNMDVEVSFFFNTFKLLTELGIMSRDSETGHRFKDTFFNRKTVEFLFPFCVPLAQLEYSDKDSFKDTDEFMFYQMVSVVSFIRILDKICNLQKNVNLLVEHGIASKYVQEVANNKDNIKCIEDDFSKFDNYHTSKNATVYVKPQITTVFRQEINDFIKDRTKPLLGNYGGITTMNNGKYRYPVTIIAAVTSRLWISELISRIRLSGPLVDPDTGKELFEGLENDLQSQQALLQKALYSILYRNFTDEDASIQWYLIADRNKVVNGIQSVRKSEAPTFLEAVSEIVNEFCECTKKACDVSKVYKNS